MVAGGITEIVSSLKSCAFALSLVAAVFGNLSLLESQSCKIGTVPWGILKYLPGCSYQAQEEVLAPPVFQQEDYQGQLITFSCFLDCESKVWSI